MNPQQQTLARVAISQSELFATWPEAAQRRVIESAETMSVDIDTEIHHSGDLAIYMYIIASGSMIFSRSPTGRRPFTMGRHVAGDFHGLGPVLTQTTYVHDAICREQTVLVRIPGKLLVEMISQDGKLSFSLFKAIERRHLRARDLYVGAAVSTTRARIADLLRSFSLRGGAGRYSCDISLSQDEIATMIGTRRQVVNRILREMAASRVINVLYGRIVILDFERLNLMAEDNADV